MGKREVRYPTASVYLHDAAVHTLCVLVARAVDARQAGRRSDVHSDEEDVERVVGYGPLVGERLGLVVAVDDVTTPGIGCADHKVLDPSDADACRSVEVAHAPDGPVDL